MVQVYFGAIDAQGQIQRDGIETLQFVSQKSDGSYLYRGVISCIRSGLQGYAIRVQPRHPLLGSAGIPGLVLWSN